MFPSFSFDTLTTYWTNQNLNKMALEDWKDLISSTATISTVINFLTGMQVRLKLLLNTLSTIERAQTSDSNVFNY